MVISMDSVGQSSQSQTMQQRKRPSQSVRFEVEDDSRQVRRRVVEVECVLNLVDKSELWVQPDEVVHTMKKVRSECAALRSGVSTFEAYVGALADSYCICAESSEKDWSTGDRPVTLSHIAYLGLARGMEPCMLPELALARADRRKKGTSSVVQLYSLVKESPQGHEIVASFAASISGSASRFAQVLGAADTASVLMEQYCPKPCAFIDTNSIVYNQDVTSVGLVNIATALA